MLQARSEASRMVYEKKKKEWCMGEPILRCKQTQNSFDLLGIWRAANFDVSQNYNLNTEKQR